MSTEVIQLPPPPNNTTMYIIIAVVILILVVVGFLYYNKTQTATQTNVSAPKAPSSSSDTKVDCKLSEWSSWSECNSEGKKKKTRYIVTRPSNGGDECPPESFLTETENCPVDCKVSGWSEWTECKGTGGLQTRSKTILVQPKNGGQVCPTETEEKRNCPIDCKVSGWSEWSTCPSCGSSTETKTKTRTIERQSKWGGSPCPAPSELKQTENCNLQPCPPEWRWDNTYDCKTGIKIYKCKKPDGTDETKTEECKNTRDITPVGLSPLPADFTPTTCPLPNPTGEIMSVTFKESTTAGNVGLTENKVDISFIKSNIPTGVTHYKLSISPLPLQIFPALPLRDFTNVTTKTDISSLANISLSLQPSKEYTITLTLCNYFREIPITRKFFSLLDPSVITNNSYGGYWGDSLPEPGIYARDNNLISLFNPMAISSYLGFIFNSQIKISNIIFYSSIWTELKITNLTNNKVYTLTTLQNSDTITSTITPTDTTQSVTAEKKLITHNSPAKCLKTVITFNPPIVSNNIQYNFTTLDIGSNPPNSIFRPTNNPVNADNQTVLVHEIQYRGAPVS